MILKELNRKHYVACLVRIQQLEQSGYELRRPAADFLRDGFTNCGQNAAGFHYRILYFFQGKNVACMTHGFYEGRALSQTPKSRVRCTRRNWLRATEIATRWYGSCDMSKKARTRNFSDVIRAKLAANPKLAESGQGAIL